VYAIGQPHLMYDIWTWCLERGLNLYVEKPLGLTIHQARSLAWLAERKGCITQVSFQRRACPMAVMLREECLKRGSITHAVCTFYKCQPQANTSARDHMMDDTVHAIDTLRWMCGGEVVEIACETRRVGAPDINFITALLEFDNGAVGVLMNSWTSGRRIFRVEMHAPGICAEAELEGKGLLYADGETKGTEFDTRQVRLRGVPGQESGVCRWRSGGAAASFAFRGCGEDDGGGGEDSGAGAAERTLRARAI
jgi:predicted dehydrogenase